MNVTRFDLDTGGLSPNNLVLGEIHDLTNHRHRVVAPKYGAYFTESIKVYDNITGQELNTTQYYPTDILTEASIKYGKEICWLLVISDTTVNSQVRISYQVLGGPYGDNTSAIANLYQNYLSDNRPVDWLNVTGKPDGVPPTLHQHILDDIYGFGPVVNAIERLRAAVLLGYTPEMDRLIAYIENRLSNIDYATPEDLIAGETTDKIITHDTMMYCCFNKDDVKYGRITPKAYYERSNILLNNVRIVNWPVDTVFYWSVEHGSTDDNNFNALSGSITRSELTLISEPGVQVSETDWTMKLPIIVKNLNEERNTFKILLHANSIDGPIVSFHNVELNPFDYLIPDRNIFARTCVCSVQPVTSGAAWFMNTVLEKPSVMLSG